MYTQPLFNGAIVDLLQYEIVFSESFILDKNAESQLAYAASASASSAAARASSTVAEDASSESSEPFAELSNRRDPREDHAASESPNSLHTYESMILKGKPYLCSIPTVTTPIQNDTSKAKDKSEEAAELARAANRGWELLQEMEGKCMYFVSGWWSYSFCYNTDVKQFHQLPPGKGAPIFPPQQDPSTPSYVLGKFASSSGSRGNNIKPQPQIDGDPQTNPSAKQSSKTPQLRAKGDSRYLVQTLSGGTPCDLTGRDRKIEVQFHCHPQSADRIGWIKEVTTCTYLMVIYTPRLCNDVAFLPTRENRAHAISCQEILSEPEVPEWRDRKGKQFGQQGLVSSSSEAGRPVVGGIEVGGMKYVGKEGRRLETPPNKVFEIPQGGRGEAEVLAEQEGKEKGGRVVRRMEDEELKKRGLDPKAVEEARRELEGVAGGKGWRLEVLDDVEGGRQLRFIVEGDDNDEGEADGEAEEETQSQGNDGEEEGDEAGTEGGSEETYKDEL